MISWICVQCFSDRQCYYAAARQIPQKNISGRDPSRKDRLMPVGIMPVVMCVLHGMVIIMMRIDRDVMPMPERIDHHLRNEHRRRRDHPRMPMNDGRRVNHRRCLHLDHRSVMINWSRVMMAVASEVKVEPDVGPRRRRPDRCCKENQQQCLLHKTSLSFWSAYFTDELTTPQPDESLEDSYRQQARAHWN